MIHIEGKFKELESNPHNRYLGVDPGLQRTGYAVLEEQSGELALLEGGVIRTTASLPLAERLVEIGEGLREVISEFQPRIACIEQIFSHTQNVKTALLMSHARGVILYCISENKIPVIHMTPREIKNNLTGSGKASKEQIQHAVTRELKLDRILEPNDVADAAAIGICLYHSVKLTRHTL